MAMDAEHDEERVVILGHTWQRMSRQGEERVIILSHTWQRILAMSGTAAKAACGKRQCTQTARNGSILKQREKAVY